MWEMDDDALVQLGMRELEQLGLARRDQLEFGFVERVPKAYPMYDADYSERVHAIRSWLDGLDNFIQVGRNGLHRYNNSDHSMLTATRAVDNLVKGTEHDIWAVNAESAYHEEEGQDEQQPYIEAPGDGVDERAAALIEAVCRAAWASACAPASITVRARKLTRPRPRAILRNDQATVRHGARQVRVQPDRADAVPVRCPGSGHGDSRDGRPQVRPAATDAGDGRARRPDVLDRGRARSRRGVRAEHRGQPESAGEDGHEWRTGTARALPGDDPRARLKAIRRTRRRSTVNAATVALMQTALLTLRVDLDRDA